MARIVGVDIPNNKRGEVALTYIYGIGAAGQILFSRKGVDPNIKVQEWNDEQFQAVRNVINSNLKLKVSFVQKCR